MIKLAEDKPKTTADLEARLAMHTGTTQYFRHPLGIVFTEGVKDMADIAGAYWLIDVVASYQPSLRHVPFQLWRLEAANSRGLVTAREDTNTPNLVRQEIEYTDFPDGRFEMYLANRVLMLKSEY